MVEDKRADMIGRRGRRHGGRVAGQTWAPSAPRPGHRARPRCHRRKENGRSTAGRSARTESDVAPGAAVRGATQAAQAGPDIFLSFHHLLLHPDVGLHGLSRPHIRATTVRRTTTRWTTHRRHSSTRTSRTSSRSSTASGRSSRATPRMSRVSSGKLLSAGSRWSSTRRTRWCVSVAFFERLGWGCGDRVCALTRRAALVALGDPALVEGL